MAREAVAWEDVQGLVLRGYDALGYACYCLLEITDVAQAKSWMATLALTPGTESPKDEATHFALTAIGLKKLGLNDDQLKTFSIPFQQGLVAEHRSRILGDFGPNDPSSWEWGGDATVKLHALLMLFDADAARLADRATSLGQATTTGCRVLRTLDARSPDDGHDHFGFLDGISQPKIQEAPKADESSDVAAGEFVLGYPDGRGERQPVPALDDKNEIGKNGTYVVLRQIEQDVGAFNHWLETHGKTASERDALAAKVVGRWRDGRPLVAFATPGTGQPADAYFDFTEDRFGFKCPLGSHVRRANPRDDLRDSDQNDKESADQSKKITAHHRIIRRGRIYGPLWRPTPEQPQPDASRRGLYFIGLNASISDQFEFIQQAWVNNLSFRGLYNEVDPLVGASVVAPRSFTVQAQPVRCRYANLPRFTTVRGGAYFFMPSLSALRKLAA